MSSGEKFNSDIWIPKIQKLCDEIVNNLKKHPGGEFLRFNNGELGTVEFPGRIVQEYHMGVGKFKDRIFIGNTRRSCIDHHKIAALYIQAFLKYKPFCLDIPPEAKNVELCLYTKLPNEYFALPFLEAIFRAGNDDFEKMLVMGDYGDYFVKLLHYYSSDTEKLDPVSFSNTIFLIEQQYFLHPTPSKMGI